MLHIDCLEVNAKYSSMQISYQLYVWAVGARLASPDITMAYMWLVQEMGEASLAPTNVAYSQSLVVTQGFRFFLVSRFAYQQQVFFS